MLYFSKLRIISIFLVSVFFIFITSSNFFDSKFKYFSKKINLGLDLQGGSYLLLEIDNTPVIEQKLQNLTTIIKSHLKDRDIRIRNLSLNDDKIIFSVEESLKQKVIDIFTDEDSEINPYYPRFKSHQLEINEQGEFLTLKFSNQGLVELKTSSQDQALEIVRRRIDEIGTNEPNILKEEMTVFL